MDVTRKIQKQELLRRLWTSSFFLIPFLWNLVDYAGVIKLVGTGLLWLLAFCWALIFPFKILTNVVAYNNNTDVTIHYLDSLLRKRTLTLPQQLVTRMTVEKAGIMIRDADEWHLKCGGQFYKFRITHSKVLENLQESFPLMPGNMSREAKMAMDN